MKRWLGFFCVLVLMMSSCVMPAFAIDGGGKGSGSIKAWGCDMSYFNVDGDNLNYSLVDYNLMLADGCDYVILRIGYEGKSSRTDVLDPSFVGLYNRARAAGMDIGLYFYSLATTYAGAAQDAQWVMNVIEQNNMYFEYPIYYDIEDSTQISMGSSAINSLCLGWCETLEAAGYFPGIYAGKTQVMDKLSADFLSRYDTWVAYYLRNTTGPQYDPENPVTATAGFSTAYGMWQYKWLNDDWTPSYNGSYWKTSDGYPLDCNVAFKDYPTIMATYGWNNVEGGNASASTTAEKLGTYKITASSLNVRKGVGTSYDIVGTLANGELVVVTELSNGWGKVSLDDGTTGWCSIGDYGNYVGIDALDTTLKAVWNEECLIMSTADNGSVTLTNTHASDPIAVDLPLSFAIGTRTTPYLNVSVTRHTGGWYFGLTEDGSGYFMMHDYASGKDLVEAQTASYRQGNATLQIALSDWWKPEKGERINDVRFYLSVGASVTVNYCYFADEANVVTSTAYNMRKAPEQPIEHGDINSDGNVDTSDARLLILEAVAQGTLNQSQWAKADVNGDGAVDTADARAVLRTITV